MERHHFHSSSDDTITAAQKACFLAGGKYCSSPPKQLRHQPLRVRQENSHFISRHTNTQDPLYLAHLGVYTETRLLAVPV